MPAAFEIRIKEAFSPIGHLLADDHISEILINGFDEIWVEKKGVLHRTSDQFRSARDLEAALTSVSQYAGRPYNFEHPILETRLPDGSRLEAVRSPVSHNGTSVSIRRFSKSTITIEKLIRFGTMDRDTARFLRAAVKKKKNIVISGGTGSGKTSLLNALSANVPTPERIVVIEDTHEIELQQPHVVYLESRENDVHGNGAIGISELLRATLRLRPDRIVIGEIRGKEAFDLMQAMSSGHAGCLTTVHASTPAEALSRLDNMIVAGFDAIPHAAIKTQLANAIDFVIQINRMPGGKRVLTQIASVHNDLDPGGGAYQFTPLLKRKS